MIEDILKRNAILLTDFLRFDATSRGFLSRALMSCDALAPRTQMNDLARSVLRLVKAARICPSPRLLARIEGRILRRIAQIDPRQLDWDTIFPKSRPREVRRAIILKRPVGPREKGVIFIAFEVEWLRLLRYADLDLLSRNYHLVLAPTWSPPHDLPFLMAAKMWPTRFFHILSRFRRPAGVREAGVERGVDSADIIELGRSWLVRCAGRRGEGI